MKKKKKKKTASLYKTERDIFAYISAKRKKKMSICFSADCNHRCLRECCKFFRVPAAEKEFKTWEKVCRSHLSHRLLNRTNNFPDSPASEHFPLTLIAYYHIQTVSLLCNKRSSSMTEPFSIVATKVHDFCL